MLSVFSSTSFQLFCTLKCLNRCEHLLSADVIFALIILFVCFFSIRFFIRNKNLANFTLFNTFKKIIKSHLGVNNGFFLTSTKSVEKITIQKRTKNRIIVRKNRLRTNFSTVFLKLFYLAAH